MKRSWWLWILLLTTGAGIIPDPVAADANVAEPPRIRNIIFIGNQQISDGALHGVMRLHQRAWWKPFQKNYYYGTDHLEADLDRILSLYRSRGLVFARLNAGVVRYITEKWVDLEIDINEGNRVYLREKQIRGINGALGLLLEKDLVPPSGISLSERALQADEASILETCYDEGFALAEVTRETRFSADSADVYFQIDPGPLVRVGNLAVHGVSQTRPHVVLREILLEPGDIFRFHRVVRSQERLFDLGLFRTVRILPDYIQQENLSPGTDEIIVDLTIDVNEKRPGWYGFGLGYSSSEDVRATGEWGYRNLWGKARGLHAKTGISYSLEQNRVHQVSGPKEWQIELGSTWPWLFGTPTRGQISTYYRVNREHLSGNKLEWRNNGVTFGTHWDLSRYRRLSCSIENKWTTEDSTFAKREYTTRFISVGLASDNRDFLLDPHKGSLNQNAFEYAGGFLGGTASFLRFSTNYISFIPLGWRFTWAHRVRCGYIHPVGEGLGADSASPLDRVPYEDRFFAGGGTTVRGYAQNSLGPDELSTDGSEGLRRGGLATVLFNAELRFDLFWQFGAVLFFDSGNVWADYKEIKWKRWTDGLNNRIYSELNTVYTLGAGLRFRTPVGPIRLDYGMKIGRARRPLEYDGDGLPTKHESDGDWHMSLGHAF